jgi:hypothetical protein
VDIIELGVDLLGGEIFSHSRRGFRFACSVSEAAFAIRRESLDKQNLEVFLS